MPVILATQEAEIRRITVQPARANSSTRPHLKKPFTKIGLVKWLKVNTEFKPQYCKKKKKIHN
jgi:hypothetical protein